MRKHVHRKIGVRGHFWHWAEWRKWGTIYGYEDDTLKVAIMRMTHYGPLVFFEI